MSETTDLQVVIKSMELIKHCYKLTSNCNRYPKKYRFSLVDRIQQKSMDIYESLLEANRTLLPQEMALRRNLQTKAITNCDELCFYIELSKELGLLEAGSVAYWSKLTNDVKYMTIAWRKQTR